MEINGWQCDICKKEFREGDAGYSNRLSIDIIVEFSLGLSSQYKFKDVCSTCRTRIDSAVQQAIDV